MLKRWRRGSAGVLAKEQSWSAEGGTVLECWRRGSAGVLEEEQCWRRNSAGVLEEKQCRSTGEMYELAHVNKIRLDC